ncbi:MAG: hypothetical protein ACKVY0_13425 [Prosthecobacter sp.]|uniref:hypothetical protein n=1 Tax=Prosthecobacter sp. TaxID=1965333 RepID=UPI003903D81C
MSTLVSVLFRDAVVFRFLHYGGCMAVTLLRPGETQPIGVRVVAVTETHDRKKLVWLRQLAGGLPEGVFGCKGEFLRAAIKTGGFDAELRAFGPWHGFTRGLHG